jgi:hypothetical protein
LARFLTDRKSGQCRYLGITFYHRCSAAPIISSD